MPSKWIDHVKAYAAKNKMSYRDALKCPACKSAYKPSKETKTPTKKMKGGNITTIPFDTFREMVNFLQGLPDIASLLSVPELDNQRFSYVDGRFVSLVNNASWPELTSVLDLPNLSEYVRNTIHARLEQLRSTSPPASARIRQREPTPPGARKKARGGAVKKDTKTCWKGYEQFGMKTKKGKQVPNCVPTKKIKGGNLFSKILSLPFDLFRETVNNLDLDDLFLFAAAHNLPFDAEQREYLMNYAYNYAQQYKPNAARALEYAQSAIAAVTRMEEEFQSPVAHDFLVELSKIYDDLEKINNGLHNLIFEDLINIQYRLHNNVKKTTTLLREFERSLDGWFFIDNTIQGNGLRAIARKMHGKGMKGKGAAASVMADNIQQSYDNLSTNDRERVRESLDRVIDTLTQMRVVAEQREEANPSDEFSEYTNQVIESLQRFIALRNSINENEFDPDDIDSREDFLFFGNGVHKKGMKGGALEIDVQMLKDLSSKLTNVLDELGIIGERRDVSNDEPDVYMALEDINEALYTLERGNANIEAIKNYIKRATSVLSRVISKYNISEDEPFVEGGMITNANSDIETIRERLVTSINIWHTRNSADIERNRESMTDTGYNRARRLNNELFGLLTDIRQTNRRRFLREIERNAERILSELDNIIQNAETNTQADIFNQALVEFQTTTTPTPSKGAGIHKTENSYVQSVVFDKSKFNKKSASEWLKKNNYVNKGVDDKENTLRFRQVSPSYIKKMGFDKFRNKKIGKNSGIMLVLAYKKGIKGGSLTNASTLRKRLSKLKTDITRFWEFIKKDGINLDNYPDLDDDYASVFHFKAHGYDATLQSLNANPTDAQTLDETDNEVKLVTAALRRLTIALDPTEQVTDEED